MTLLFVSIWMRPLANNSCYAHSRCWQQASTGFNLASHWSVLEASCTALHCIARLSLCRLFSLPRHLATVIPLQEYFVVLGKRTPEQRELLWYIIAHWHVVVTNLLSASSFSPSFVSSFLRADLTNSSPLFRTWRKYTSRTSSTGCPVTPLCFKAFRRGS